MKHIVGLFTILFVLSMDTSFAQDHSIPGVSPKKSVEAEAIVRSVKHGSGKIGLNGALTWINDGKGREVLVLVTPSGRHYKIVSTDSVLEHQLVKLSEEKRNQIEVLGTITTENGDARLSIETLDSAELAHEGRYVIVAKKDLTPLQTQVIKWNIAKLPTTKTLELPSEEGTGANVTKEWTIETDLSKTQLEKLILDKKLHTSIESIKRAPELKIGGGEIKLD